MYREQLNQVNVSWEARSDFFFLFKWHKRGSLSMYSIQFCKVGKFSNSPISHVCYYFLLLQDYSLSTYTLTSALGAGETKEKSSNTSTLWQEEGVGNVIVGSQEPRLPFLRTLPPQQPGKLNDTTIGNWHHSSPVSLHVMTK